MKINNLACRTYKINPNHLAAVKSLFTSNPKILYDTYRKGTDDQLELFFSVKKTEKNNHGKLIQIYLDKIMFVPQRNNKEEAIRYTPTYVVQLLEKTESFENYLIVFGPKTIDSGIKNALTKHISEISEDEVSDPLILLKVDFDKIKKLAKEFPNIQHFCIKDVNDDRLQDVIIKGDMLEKTPQYKEFVIEEDTKGSVNFLGITLDGKLFYIGKDGSIYSRNNFSRTDVTSVVYSLLVRISTSGAFNTKTLDDF